MFLLKQDLGLFMACNVNTKETIVSRERMYKSMNTFIEVLAKIRSMYIPALQGRQSIFFER